jgi:predicted dehydrogenase
MNELEYYSAEDAEGRQGFRLIQATEAVHPYAGHYWPTGHIIGYEHTFVNLVADALVAMHEGRPISPDLEDGYRNQRVLDAVERSHGSRQWIRVTGNG